MRSLAFLTLIASACGPAASVKDAGPPPPPPKDAGVVDAGTPCRAGVDCAAGATCQPAGPSFAGGHPCRSACTCDSGKLTCTLACAPDGGSCPPPRTTANTCTAGMICEWKYGTGDVVQCTCGGDPKEGPVEPWTCF